MNFVGLKQKGEPMVCLNKINLTDFTYRISTDKNIEPLCNSIKTIGLINEPIVREQNDSYQIISGFRRVIAFQTLGFDNIPVKVVENNIDKTEYAILAITDNISQRPLNIIEQSRAICLLLSSYKEKQAACEVAKSLGLVANDSMIDKLQTVSTMPESLQNAILNDSIPLTIALELNQLESDQSEIFSELFQKLQISLNKQREILVLIKEIAIRENKSISEIFYNNETQQILNAPNKDRNQKSNELRIYLKRRRFPNITQTEERFNNTLKNLRLPQGMQLIPPANFESTTYTIKLELNNINDLKQYHKKIGLLINEEAGYLKDILTT